MGKLIGSRDNPNKVIIHQRGDSFDAYPSCCVGLFTRLGKSQWHVCMCKRSSIQTLTWNSRFTLEEGEENGRSFFDWLERWTGWDSDEMKVSIQWS